MLNVIGGGTSVDQSTLPDWVSIYAQSDLYKENAAQLQQLSQPKGQVPSFDTPYARSFAVQFKEIIKRLGRLYCQQRATHARPSIQRPGLQPCLSLSLSLTC